MDLATKALDVTAVVLEKYSPEIASKSTKFRCGLNRNRPMNKRRDGSTSKPDAIDGAAVGTDFADGARDAYQFLLKYKHLTSSQDVRHLELLEKHLNKIIPASSGALQTEIFKKLVLPIFANFIPLFNGEIIPAPECVHLIEKCLGFLPNFLRNDELLQTFAQKNGVSFLEMFARNDHLAPLAFEALRQMLQRPSQRVVSNADGKSVRIFKDPSPKTKPSTKNSKDLTVEAISLIATEALLSSGKKCIADVHEGPVTFKGCCESIVWNSASWENTLNLLAVYNELQMESSNFKEHLIRENWHQKCFDLVRRSVSIINDSLTEKELPTERVDETLKFCLPTLVATVPICLSVCSDIAKVSTLLKAS